MSWNFSLALVAEYSGANFSDGGLSVPSKSSQGPVPNSQLVRMTAASKRFLYGTTFAPSPSGTEWRDPQSARFAARAIALSSKAVSPVKESAWPERAKGWRISVPVFGASRPESLARYDRSTSSWKTHQLSLFGGGFESLETLPPWGMTVGGELYPLPTPSGLMELRASITSESGFGLSERVPTTPRRIDGRSATENTTDGCLIRRFEKEGGTNLAEFVQMSQRRLLPVPRVPTPMKSDADKWNNMTASERIAKGQFVRLQNYLSTPEERVGGSLKPRGFPGDGAADRVDRLYGTGNGQVPAVVRLAWETLKP